MSQSSSGNFPGTFGIFRVFSCFKNVFWCLLELFSHWKVISENNNKNEFYPIYLGEPEGPTHLPTASPPGPAADSLPAQARPIWAEPRFLPGRPWPGRRATPRRACAARQAPRASIKLRARASARALAAVPRCCPRPHASTAGAAPVAALFAAGAARHHSRLPVQTRPSVPGGSRPLLQLRRDKPHRRTRCPPTEDHWSATAPWGRAAGAANLGFWPLPSIPGRGEQFHNLHYSFSTSCAIQPSRSHRSTPTPPARGFPVRPIQR
jgi:hypothetical protein